MEVVYSASALGAFSGNLLAIGFFFVLGFGNLLLLLFTRSRRRRRKAGNYVMGCLSVLLVFFGVLMVIATYNTYQNGDATVLVQVEEKNIVKRNCKSITRVCTDYVVDATDGRKFYTFAMAEDLWKKIDVNACYDITYYPSKPLLGDYLQEDNQYADLYEAVANIILIRKADCP